MANIDKFNTEESGNQDSSRSNDGPTKPKPETEYKQPRPRPDNWADETKKTRTLTMKLLENLQQRNDALREGQPTTKQDYMLRTGVNEQKLNI